MQILINREETPYLVVRAHEPTTCDACICIPHLGSALQRYMPSTRMHPPHPTFVCIELVEVVDLSLHTMVFSCMCHPAIQSY